MAEPLRIRILNEVAKYTGQRVSYKFLKSTSDFIPSIERIHNLITGIFKPSWSEFALSIIMRNKSPYDTKDDLVFLEDGRWLMTYSPREGGLKIPDNQALIKCMDSRVPLAVFQQLTDKTNRQYGSTYRVLGLGLITYYDVDRDVFVIESADFDALNKVTNNISDEEERYEVQLYAQLTNRFQSFTSEQRVSYNVSSVKRDSAFRHLILREYGFTCSLCKMKFQLGSLVEATAAHIVPKRLNGTDDPRNGLSLCRTHHWAFDAGIFSLDDDYSVILSPAVNQANIRNFNIEQLAEEAILLPENEVLRPHPEALEWHRKNIFLES